MSEETITISKKDYDKMMSELLWLCCLEEAGVDNWEGIDFAREAYDEAINVINKKNVL